MTEQPGQRVRINGKGICRILSYDGNGYFTVLTQRDEHLFVPRHRMTFLRKGNQNGNLTG